jgi:hypothetical protein
VADGIDPVAVEALAKLMLDPTPRIKVGTRAKPGILIGKGPKIQAAAVFLESHGLIEKTDLIEPKSRQPLYRISSQGIAYVLENSEPVQLLREIKDGLQGFLLLRDRVETALKGIEQQQRILDVLFKRMTAPTIQQSQAPTIQQSPAPPLERIGNWLGAALKYVSEFQRSHPNQFCPLPAVYRSVAEPAGASLGAFSDGIRRLVQEGKLRLHPYTRALYTIEDEECALVAGKEIKYYAQYIDGHAAS